MPQLRDVKDYMEYAQCSLTEAYETVMGHPLVNKRKRLELSEVNCHVAPVQNQVKKKATRRGVKSSRVSVRVRARKKHTPCPRWELGMMNSELGIRN